MEEGASVSRKRNMILPALHRLDALHRPEEAELTESTVHASMIISFQSFSRSVRLKSFPIPLPSQAKETYNHATESQQKNVQVTGTVDPVEGHVPFRGLRAEKRNSGSTLKVSAKGSKGEDEQDRVLLEGGPGKAQGVSSEPRASGMSKAKQIYQFKGSRGSDEGSGGERKMSHGRRSTTRETP